MLHTSFYEPVYNRIESSEPDFHFTSSSNEKNDMFLTKIPIAPCYCQMMGRTLKEEIKITQYNNPTKAGKYSMEDLFRASDNIPHHYPKF